MKRFKKILAVIICAVMVCGVINVEAATGVSIDVGETKTLTATKPSTTYTPSGSVTYSYAWFSDDTSIVKFSGSTTSQSATIVGKAAGTTTVFVNRYMSYYYYSGTVKQYGFEDKKQSWTVTVLGDGTYTVTYNANGGSGAPSSQTKTGGTALTLSSTIPTRDGYTFTGWNTSANGSGTSYSAGGTYTKDANVTLYAQWEIESDISIGEYMRLGTYYGEDILWRCVDIDDNGALMLSDKIIDLKCFDAPGTNASASHGRSLTYSYRKVYGSNYWADSNLRSWLNSDEAAGKVTWLCGNAPSADNYDSNYMICYNPYDDEAGFKTNFSEDELAAVKTVTQYTIVPIDEDLDQTTVIYSGSEVYTPPTSSEIEAILTNEDVAYTVSSVDDFFVLDTEQIYAVYANSNVLGENYFVGEPTAKCAENAEESGAEGEEWYSWLRTPYTYVTYSSSSGTYTYCVEVYNLTIGPTTSSGNVFTQISSEGRIGVRPAFYLNNDVMENIYGSGTEDDPYAISEDGDTVVAKGTCGDKLTWKLTGEGVLTISGTGDMTNYTSTSAIPWYSQREVITSVVIEDGVTSVGDRAFFGCTSLTEVSVSDSVTSMGKWVFRDCSSLTDVDLGNSVTSIGEDAFYGCESLSEISIPDSVTSIGYWAFRDCSSLTGVRIPAGVTSIGEDAFDGCTNLTAINVDGANESYCSVDGVLFSKDMTELIICPEGKEGAYSIPDGVTSIGYNAFYCCSLLTEISFPESVTSINTEAFSGCVKLAAINVDGANESYCSVDGVLFSKDMTELILCPVGKEGAYSIPAGVTSISDEAFAGCRLLTGVSIPGSVTTIGENAFFYCESLTDVSMGSGVTTIGEWAFAGCTSLTDVSLGDNLTSIGSFAFAECENIRSISIPDSVTEIGEEAFFYCTSLNSVVIGEGVTTIEYEVFTNCESLNCIFLPSTVTYIDDAFYGCECLFDVYYAGTEEEFNEIEIESEELLYAEIHYNCTKDDILPEIVSVDAARLGGNVIVQVVSKNIYGLYNYNDYGKIYVAGYADGTLVTLQETDDDDCDFEWDLIYMSSEVDEVKVFAWGGLNEPVPLCEAVVKALN